jgi:HD-like signal output (HDOD) protein
MQAGELMLRRWHITELVCRVVGNHHQPEAVRDAAGGLYELTSICKVGAVMGKFLTHKVSRPKLMSQATRLAHDLLGVSGDQLQGVLGLVRMRLEASAEMFEVRLDETMIRRLDAAIRDRIAETVMGLTDMAGPGR